MSILLSLQVPSRSRGVWYTPRRNYGSSEKGEPDSFATLHTNATL